ncbi:MAG: tRNA 2-thiouridine(34) synthase MnmA [Spirochaetales bacterium]|nr:MAG: tRNA 2-thiouridine(34) synthase MnmA [Spirochaetales bacterium]
MDEHDLSRYSGKTVAVGLSGGVDSSLAAALLHQAGALVSGITMKIFKEGAVPAIAGNLGDACYGPGEAEDIDACAGFCDSLGIPYHVIDLADEYEERILKYFRAEYRTGRTPNPCVRCNRDMKFGFMLERARSAGAEFTFFATGHYARIAERNGILHLRRAIDETKDQTYFIHRLAPETLSTIVFPLGGMTKNRVRELAQELGLAAAKKPESQDFVAGGYGSLFDDEAPGDIVDSAGNVLGRHRGIAHYTIGQRRGIGVSLGPKAMYVAALDPVKNRVVISDDASLFSGGLVGSEAFLADKRLEGSSVRAQVRIRQNHKPAPASVVVSDGRATVRFDLPQRAVAPGQSAVFYDGEGFVLGGCIIDAAEK